MKTAEEMWDALIQTVPIGRNMGIALLRAYAAACVREDREKIARTATFANLGREIGDELRALPVEMP